MKRNCTEASFDRQLNFRRNVFVEKNHQPNSSSFNKTNLDLKEAATRGVLCKKVFLEVSQNSQANNCARVSFLIKSQAWGLQPEACFPVNFVKFLRTLFLQNTSGRLLLVLRFVFFGLFFTAIFFSQSTFESSVSLMKSLMIDIYHQKNTVDFNCSYKE